MSSGGMIQKEKIVVMLRVEGSSVLWNILATGSLNFANGQSLCYHCSSVFMADQGLIPEISIEQCLLLLWLVLVCFARSLWSGFLIVSFVLPSFYISNPSLTVLLKRKEKKEKKNPSIQHKMIKWPIYSSVIQKLFCKLDNNTERWELSFAFY